MSQKAQNFGGSDWVHKVEQIRSEAATMPDGPARTELIKKADQLSAAYLLYEAMTPRNAAR